MPRRFAIGNAQDLVRAERDIRARIGEQELDFAAFNQSEDLVSTGLSEGEKDQLASLLRTIIRTVEAAD